MGVGFYSFVSFQFRYPDGHKSRNIADRYIIYSKRTARVNHLARKEDENFWTIIIRHVERDMDVFNMCVKLFLQERVVNIHLST